MVKPTLLKDGTTLKILGSAGLASAWYAVANGLLDGTAVGAVIPVFGAIAIATTVPLILQQRAAKKLIHDRHFSMSQRLDALSEHTCIKIANAHGKIVEVNDKMLELTGYDRNDLLNQSVDVMYHEPEPGLIDEIRSTLSRGESWEGETRLRSKNGQVVDTQATIMPIYDSSGELAGSISVRTDVSNVKALIEERHTAQTLYELRDDVWIIDSETEAFNYMNRTAETRFDVTRGGYRGQSLVGLHDTDDTTKIIEACRALRASGTSMTRFESSLMGVPVEVSIKFLSGAEYGGRYLILISDISARVQQEKQKSAFISTVSHELRSPLTSIKGAMGLLLSRSAGELPDKALSLLEIAHRNADRLILIINDILDLDKIANGEMEFDRQDTDLAALVREADQATAMLQQRFGMTVEMSGVDAPIPFYTDPNRFIQILTNLLSNAYKFSAPNSKILIEIKDAGGQMRISVTDEGQGIPAAEQHKIFTRFSDMTNSDRALKGGTGLGLNICKAIVETMGGTIGFDTQEGVGTTFYFYLPKATSGMKTLADASLRRIA